MTEMLKAAAHENIRIGKGKNTGLIVLLGPQHMIPIHDWIWIKKRYRYIYWKSLIKSELRKLSGIVPSHLKFSIRAN